MLAFKEELAEILRNHVVATELVVDGKVVSHLDLAAQSIIEAFNKIVPEKKSSLLTGLYNLEENKGHNQCVDQIERAINE
jgi:hypothetical protein